jgi:hypothetical protein
VMKVAGRQFGSRALQPRALLETRHGPSIHPVLGRQFGSRARSKRRGEPRHQRGKGSKEAERAAAGLVTKETRAKSGWPCDNVALAVRGLPLRLAWRRGKRASPPSNRASECVADATGTCSWLGLLRSLPCS